MTIYVTTKPRLGPYLGSQYRGLALSLHLTTLQKLRITNQKYQRIPLPLKADFCVRSCSNLYNFVDTKHAFSAPIVDKDIQSRGRGRAWARKERRSPRSPRSPVITRNKNNIAAGGHQVFAAIAAFAAIDTAGTVHVATISTSPAHLHHQRRGHEANLITSPASTCRDAPVDSKEEILGQT